MHTEYLINVGIYAELVLDHGWHPGRLEFQTSDRTFDVAGVDHAGRYVLLVEAKARSQELDRRERDLAALENTPDAAVSAGVRKQWTRLCAELTDGPLQVWLVASGVRRIHHYELDHTSRPRRVRH